MNVVAGHAHHALDVVLLDVHRIAEHDDVAALGLGVGQQMLADGAGWRVGQLVHQQVIADQTVVSMDGVGTMNACTSVVVPNSRIRI